MPGRSDRFRRHLVINADVEKKVHLAADPLCGSGREGHTKALEALVADARPGSAVRVGVCAGEGPRDIVIRAGLPAGGAAGFAREFEGLFGASR